MLFTSLILAAFLFLAPLTAWAKEKICLNMIVKDESAVIRRCLDSVKPLIDYWVIVDTGSKDGTQEIIKEHMRGIPGELHERAWRNFGENRTEALLLAQGKGDYILFMDADDVLEYKKGFKFTGLKHDLYNMWRGTSDFTYLKPQLVKSNLPWKWVGVTHEYLDCERLYTMDTFATVRYISKDDGASSHDPKKFLRNVDLLKTALKKEPGNTRYAFYLAESYRDAGKKAQALECFQKRANMGGWPEEVYWSLLQIGHLLRDLGCAPSLVIEAYRNAFNYRPHRAEAVYFLAEKCNQEKRYAEAYAYLKSWKTIPQPVQKDGLFNMNWIEDYGLLFQLSIASYYVGQYQEAIDACDQLLAMGSLPETWRTYVVANRAFPIAKLAELQKDTTEISTQNS